MPSRNKADAIPQGTVVRLDNGLAVVGDGPDLDGQYRVVRLFSESSGPGFADEHLLVDVIGQIGPNGEFGRCEPLGDTGVSAPVPSRAVPD